MRRCPEDSSMCIPVEQYCDGIPQCPDAGDEVQSGCSCEDWGLLSCTEEDHEHTKCLDKNWTPAQVPNQSICQAMLNSINTSVDPRSNTGMYLYPSLPYHELAAIIIKELLQ